MKYVENMERVLDRERTGTVDCREGSEPVEQEEYIEHRNHMGHMEHGAHMGCMEHMEQNVWEALHMFRRLNIGSILPHLNKGEFVLMNGIYHVQKKIGSEHGVKMSDLAEYTHALPPAVSRSIKALEQKGYVRRFVDAKDRRNTLVEITDSGQEVLQESNEIMDEFIRRVFEKTDKEEMARLVSYIYQQYDLAKEELEKIRESQKKAADKDKSDKNPADKDTDVKA
ncbi:MarR family winged helix-turn-helix transcriptional regulator [uncultured Eubacterium sp.]|uniref:MarR family winged helix-turn-helix transcriptional regulator n=1 Tax=uncultured Eubacterium sp. TaxID=165185 RepID=UPI0025EEAD6E|nr:MarR family transcriptional regulator [uncultured Eubacterium sp.]MCI6538018.1 MarR family transcriptional regulator [Lachnospiraceae bacterium]